jgi:hypothetical protein
MSTSSQLHLFSFALGFLLFGGLFAFKIVPQIRLLHLYTSLVISSLFLQQTLFHATALSSSFFASSQFPCTPSHPQSSTPSVIDVPTIILSDDAPATAAPTSRSTLPPKPTIQNASVAPLQSVASPTSTPIPQDLPSAAGTARPLIMDQYSVVICTYHRYSLLLPLVQTLRKYKLNYEVIVVWNNVGLAVPEELKL